MKISFSLFVSILVAGSTAWGAEDYAIKMQQPLKVGQHYKFTTTASELSRTTMGSGGKVMQGQTNSITVDMESDVTVDQVDAQGRPTKETHKIVKLLERGAKEPALAAGTKLVAMRLKEKMAFEVDGKPADATTTRLLALTITMNSGGPTDDEIFGTTERKKIGDSWKINQDAAMKDATEKMAGQGMTIESISGQTTLESVTKEGGTDVLHLKSNMTAKVNPKPQGPFTSAEAKMEANFTGAFPADPLKAKREEGVEMTMTFRGAGKPNPNGPEMELIGVTKRTSNSTSKLTP